MTPFLPLLTSSLGHSQDGATLKGRFDQIFESTRYTKALDDIRKQRKERMAELREMEHAYAALSVAVNASRKLVEQLETQRSRSDELAETVDRLNGVRVGPSAAAACCGQNTRAFTSPLVLLCARLSCRISTS